MYDSDDDIVMPDVVLHDTHDTPITKELRRRKCSFFHIEPLDENLCGKILEHNATRVSVLVCCHDWICELTHDSIGGLDFLEERTEHDIRCPRQ